MHLFRHHQHVRATVLRRASALAAVTSSATYAVLLREHPAIAGIVLLVTTSALVALLQQTLH